MALAQLIRLRDGPFEFVLDDDAPQAVGGREIARETLERGLNVQELLLELTRGMDEDRRDSSAALEASFAPAPQAGAEGETGADRPAVTAAPAPPASSSPRPSAKPTSMVPGAAAPPAASSAAASAPARAAAARTLLVVDDEEDVRRVLARFFQEAGFRAVEAEGPEAAVRKARELGAEGAPFVLVADLGMPTTGGASFQGGFEVVRRLARLGLQPPVLLMTESLNALAQTRARELGIGGIVFKPGLSKLDPRQFEADLNAFARKLVDDVLPKLTSPRPIAKAEAPPRRAVAGPGVARPRGARQKTTPARAPVTSESGDLGRQIALLQRVLEELRQRGDPGRISSVLMRAAREFYSRGLLFLVKGDMLRGLGGYGPAPQGGSLALLAREVAIPLGERSVFRDVVREKRVFSGPAPEDPWARSLLERIGRFRSREVALLPLVAQRETIAVLFLDNPDTGNGAPRLDVLELFVNQAGIALENAFLQRKLQSLGRA
jgi:CheY-like chemotaxis protein